MATVQLNDPLDATPSGPAARTADKQLEVLLDGWVSMTGPGNWAKKAAWDEYRFSLTNVSGHDVIVHQVAIYDQESFRSDTTGNLKQLTKQSKVAAKRARKQGLRLDAYDEGTPTLATGGVVLAGGISTGVAGLGGSATAAGAAGIAAVGLVAAPILIAASVVQSHRAHRVANSIRDRQIQLPLTLKSGESIQTSAFFPMLAVPRFVEFSYSSLDQSWPLRMDLRGLYQQPRKAESTE